MATDTATPDMPPAFAAEGDIMTHLGDHDTYTGGRLSEACPYCAAATLLPYLLEAWRTGTSAERTLLWSMQDGYGEAGYTPAQGYDWSGIRDSKPATIYRMHQALMAARGVTA